MSNRNDIATQRDELLVWARESSHSDFFQSHWGAAQVFDDLPLLTSADLVRVPASARTYKHATSIVKIVPHPGSFVYEWALEDIAAENYGVHGTRAVVYMHDAHDAIEKSLWCYERGMLPLAAELDPNLTRRMMQKFQPDVLITTTPDYISLAQAREGRGLRCGRSSIIDTSFRECFGSLGAFDDMTVFILGRPETGAIAHSSPQQFPFFSLMPGVYGEGPTLTITKITKLVTPLIKYDTKIAVSWVSADNFELIGG